MFIVFQRALKCLLLALCLPVLALAQPAQPPIKIALIEGLSGPFANTGESMSQAGSS
jgi:branched-chain amino acid transport system substrate-binding protein